MGVQAHSCYAFIALFSIFACRIGSIEHHNCYGHAYASVAFEGGDLRLRLGWTTAVGPDGLQRFARTLLCFVSRTYDYYSVKTVGFTVDGLYLFVNLYTSVDCRVELAVPLGMMHRFSFHSGSNMYGYGITTYSFAFASAAPE